MRDWFQDPPWIPNPWIIKSLIQNSIKQCIQLVLYIHGLPAADWNYCFWLVVSWIHGCKISGYRRMTVLKKICIFKFNLNLNCKFNHIVQGQLHTWRNMPLGFMTFQHSWQVVDIAVPTLPRALDVVDGGQVAQEYQESTLHSRESQFSQTENEVPAPLPTEAGLFKKVMCYFQCLAAGNKHFNELKHCKGTPLLEKRRKNGKIVDSKKHIMYQSAVIRNKESQGISVHLCSLLPFGVLPHCHSCLFAFYTGCAFIWSYTGCAFKVRWHQPL